MYKIVVFNFLNFKFVWSVFTNNILFVSFSILRSRVYDEVLNVEVLNVYSGIKI